MCVTCVEERFTKKKLKPAHFRTPGRSVSLSGQRFVQLLSQLTLLKALQTAAALVPTKQDRTEHQRPENYFSLCMVLIWPDRHCFSIGNGHLMVLSHSLANILCGLFVLQKCAPSTDEVPVKRDMAQFSDQTQVLEGVAFLWVSLLL